jgi:superfamily II DNA or RNA helicase
LTPQNTPHDSAQLDPVTLRGDFSLASWQENAVERWAAGDSRGPHRGTLEIFTGGGKTLIALAAFARISKQKPQTKLAVVAPTEALARQWVTVIGQRTSLKRSEIGLLGAGKRDSFEGKRALVTVLNTAAKKLPELATGVDSLMLVVDEAHRAGAKTFSRVLTTAAKYRLGLSATPARDEVDENGLPLTFDRQIVGRQLGDVVFRFGLREAREAGWLPNYVVHHHGVRLTETERREYEQISRKVNDAADRLSLTGFQTSQAWQLAARGDEAAAAAQAYVAAVAARKDFLYRVSERSRVAADVVERTMERGNRRVLMFHERVAEAAALYEELRGRLPNVAIALEHSDLADGARKNALEQFRTGQVSVLVSVKSLVEGIDVPDADVGVSVASSSSVRQRIQTLGRVLRRRFDGGEKNAEMHVFYVQDTVDELIYGKEDWSDLTGADSNQYWLHPLGEGKPVQQSGPPLKPRPTEEMEWLRLGEKVPDEPVRWMGEVPDLEFSADTRGNVTSSEGAWIENPQGTPTMVEKVRGRAGGRFRVTPEFDLVIVYGESEEGMVPFVAGRLTEPFRIVQKDEPTQEAPDVTSLVPGAHYPGPTDKELGILKIRQKRGGVIEMKTGPVTRFAEMEGDDPRAEAARRLIAAWKGLDTEGLTFFINRLGHAWFKEGGQPRFLAAVQEGFLWPD